MARELVMRSWCDGDHDEAVEATVSRTLRIDNGVPYVLDLCDVCDKVVQDVIFLLDRGVPEKQALVVPGTRKKPGPTPRVTKGTTIRHPRSPDPKPVPHRADGRDRTDCPDCDYDGPTRSALGQHLSANHGKKFSDYDWTVR